MIIFSDFVLFLDKKQVLNSIDCRESLPIYDEVSSIYDDFYSLLNSWIAPKGFYRFVKNSNPNGASHNVYCLLTLGQKISDIINDKFNKNEYLEGMLINSMSDFLLFEFSRQLYKHLKEEALLLGLGLSRKYSPGERDISMEYNREILNYLNIPEEFNISLTSGFMASPPKSMAYFYKADEALNSGEDDHDCSKCTKKDCKMKKV